MTHEQRARHRVANMTPEQVEAKHRRDNRYRRHRRATDPELRDREPRYSRYRWSFYESFVRAAERQAREWDAASALFGWTRDDDPGAAA